MAFIAGQVSQDGDVIMSSPENRFHEKVRPSLDAVGANVDRVHLERSWRFPRDLDALERAIIETRARLVILDPIAAHLDFEGRRGISRFNDSIRMVSGPLDQIAERQTCGIVATEHVLKHLTARAPLLQAVGGGSSGLPAAAQMIFVIGRDPNDDERLILCQAKSNMKDDPEPFAFRRDSMSYIDEDGRTGTAGLVIALGEIEFPDPISILLRPREEKPGLAPSKLADACEWLAKFLHSQDGFARKSEIDQAASANGITSGTLTRAKSALGLEAYQEARAWWWKLPADLKASMDAEGNGNG